jgi:hypothetical protein
MKPSEYLDLVRESIGAPSDYALQKPLGLSKSMLSRYRNDQDAFSDETALRVAELCKISPSRVLVDMHVERSKTPEVRAVWADLMMKMEKISASFNALLSGSWSGVERRRDYSRRLAHAR